MRRAATGTALAAACALWLVILALVFAPPAAAAPSPGEGAQSLLGNDVSWPQCNKALPKGAAFAIIGVNNGRANTTNPCLNEQLKWANAIDPNGDGAENPTGQPTVALYVNTANPGLAGSWWPTSNDYPAGKPVHNPHGDCRENSIGVPEVTEACSYMYGYAKAYDDAYIRGVGNPSDYLWWLDVETGNSWSGDRNRNRAVLEGMTDFFHSIGADVGIYSSGYQWRQIVGTVNSSSSLYTLPSWLAGALTATGAEAKCSHAPLTAGGTVMLTQFVYRGFDYNYSCI
ncbi:hypothetical protein [Arthrobacter sp. B6]|uniref:hypothetical protein n=1 Tax=Arthrobacter sp. B6 TaxID=1570137 RepID=UPI00082B2B20|nr:hypothetical protein [Arthrobacter sp. B6]